MADGVLDGVVPPAPPDPATGPGLVVLDVPECCFDDFFGVVVVFVVDRVLDFADGVAVPQAVAIRDRAIPMARETPSFVDLLRTRPPVTAWPTRIPAEAYC